MTTSSIKSTNPVKPKKRSLFKVVHPVFTKISIAITFMCVMGSSANADLVHPGGWHTQDDLDQIRNNVAAQQEPWITGWNDAENEGPDANFSVNEDALITNNGSMHRAGFGAWVLTMKWVASGDKAYSDAAIDVINHWVDRVTDFDVYGPTLTVSTGAGAMAQAAEILEHGFNGEAGWRQSDADAAKTWFKSVIYDPWTNTGIQSSSNWGTSALGGNMSMAIFMDDESAYDYQVNAFQFGYPNTDDGCTSVTDYVTHATGQSWESGRDQSHVQGGIAHLTEAALIMWNQGDDLVYLADNRLLAGVEYHARFNLGFNDLPFSLDIPNPCNLTRLGGDVIAEEDRGDFSPVYYMSAKLFSKAGLPHPNTEAVLTSRGYSPEDNNFAHPGLGMFAFVSTDDDEGSTPTPPTSAPRVSFVSPEQSDNLDAGAALSVLVDADDINGDIISVNLSIDGDFVRTERQAPYAWSVRDTQLQNLPAGAHTLTAVATDDDGLRTEASIEFTVGGGVTGSGSDFLTMKKSNSASFALAADSGGSNNQNVFLGSEASGNQNQHWEEISRGDTYYSYKKRGTNTCLDGGNGGENRQNVILWTCSTDNQNQHWKKVMIGNNYRLEKRNAPGYSIDGNNGGSNGQNVYLWQSSNTNGNQQWKFENR